MNDLNKMGIAELIEYLEETNTRVVVEDGRITNVEK